jgi:hypothetical protein
MPRIRRGRQNVASSRCEFPSPGPDGRSRRAVALCITDIDKDLGSMTVNFDPYIRGRLRHLTKEKP